MHHIDAVQIEYSPFAIEIENPDIALLKACRELGVATVAYSPLARYVSHLLCSRDFAPARRNKLRITKWFRDRRVPIPGRL